MEKQSAIFIDPSYIEPHLSTKLYRSTYNYLCSYYTEQFFNDICNELKIPKDYLLADDNWVSIKFAQLFAELVRKKTNDDEVYRKIGNSFFSPNNINQVEYQIIKAISPIGFFNAISKSYAKTNQVCSMHKISSGLGSYKFRVSIDEPHYLYDDMLKNTLGIFQAVGKLYDLKKFSVKMSMNSDLRKADFDVEFSIILYVLKVLFNGLVFIILGLFSVYFMQQLGDHLNIYFLRVITILLFMSLFFLYRSRLAINSINANNVNYYESTREKNLQLYKKSERLDRRYSEAKLLKELSQSLVATNNVETVIQKCLRGVSQKFGYNKIAVFLISEERKVLYLYQSYGFEEIENLKNGLEFKYPNREAKDKFFAGILDSGQSQLIDNVEEYKNILLIQNKDLLDMLNVGSLIVCPIQTKEKKHGLFVALSDSKDRILNKDDKFLLENISNMLALFLENAFNFNKEIKLRNIFEKYVPASVLYKIGSNSSNGILKPTKKEICSMFIDLRGFTTYSESFPAEKLFHLISSFTEYVTRAVSKNGGVIDNIVGDEIICLFPAVDHSNTHIVDSIGAVYSILNSIDDLNKSMDSQGLPKVSFGIGLHAGAAFIGTVGCDTKYNLTALGDTVNIASRLQGISKMFSQHQVVAVVSREIAERSDSLYLKKLKSSTIVLKGRNEPTSYVVLTLDDFKNSKEYLNFKGAA